MKYQPDVVIMHFPCDDGWTAALVVQRYLTENKLKSTFAPGNYDNKDDAYWLDLVRGKNVLVVDFSFKGPLRKKLETACESMLILDHHASAKIEYGSEARSFDEYIKQANYFEGIRADLEDDKIIMLLADDKCGSSMAWAFFFPNKKRPKLIDYIEDQDLGKRQLDNATSFTYWLRSQEQRKNHNNIEFLDILDDPDDLVGCFEQGNAVYRFVKTALGNAAKTVSIGPVNLEDGNEEIQIAVSYCPYELASEFANIMVETYPKIMAAMVFYHLPQNKIGVSIRGQKVKGKNTTYARRLATALGGGGHDMAAGASLDSIREFIALLDSLTEDWDANPARGFKG